MIHVWYSTASLSLEFKNSTDLSWLCLPSKRTLKAVSCSLSDKPSGKKHVLQIRDVRVWSEQASDVSIHHSKTIYNFLQGKSLGLLETSSLNACLCVGMHKHVYIDITAESQMWLETKTKTGTVQRMHHLPTANIFLPPLHPVLGFQKSSSVFPGKIAVIGNILAKARTDMPQKRNTFTASCK